MRLPSRFSTLISGLLGLSACTADDVAATSTDTSDSTTDARTSTDTVSSDSSTGDPDESTTDESTTDESTTDTGTDPGCGDGLVDASEDCDGDELGGVTCEDLGFGGGALACDASCVFDTQGCVDIPDIPALQLSFASVKQFEFSWAAVADADFYQLEESSAPGEPFVQLGEDIVGTAVAHIMPLHFRYQASYRLRACNILGCVDSAPVAVMSSLAEAVGYVKASNTGPSDEFGGKVALSRDGRTLAVAARQEKSSATGVNGDQTDDATGGAGAVYVFVRDDLGVWSQQAYVKASNPDPFDYFGLGLALSGDGDTLAVGAPFENGGATGINGNQGDDSKQEAGAVYVYVRDGMGSWTHQAYVKASNTDINDKFGSAVGLSDDGNTLAVGAPSESSGATGINGDQGNDANNGYGGAVYVFTRSNMGSWSQQAYVKASNTDQQDYFGTALALSGDGDTLAVGADNENGGASGINGDDTSNSASNAGAVYVYVRDGMGVWAQQAYVKASVVQTGDRFGYEVALSQDGDTLAASAYDEDSNAVGVGGEQYNEAAQSAGAAYVFVRDGMGVWTEQAYVKASNTDAYDQFVHVALSGDGDVLAVGAHAERSSAIGIGGDQADNSLVASGAVYVFVRDNLGAWAQSAYVHASNPSDYDSFGTSVALSGDGYTLAVGGHGEDSDATGIGGDQTNEAASGAGAVYLY